MVNLQIGSAGKADPNIKQKAIKFNKINQENIQWPMTNGSIYLQK